MGSVVVDIFILLDFALFKFIVSFFFFLFSSFYIIYVLANKNSVNLNEKITLPSSYEKVSTKNEEGQHIITRPPTGDAAKDKKRENIINSQPIKLKTY